MQRILSILLIVGLFIFPGRSITQSDLFGDRSVEQIAPLLSGMGDLHFPVRTDDSLAQKYFNQGLILSFGFNHKEAHRSFHQAALLDSNLAMAYWGQALVLGPNINAAMNPDHNEEAYLKSRKALQKSKYASPKERALIKALTYRYVKNPPEDRTILDHAYANAMKEAAQQFPEDPQILALYGEALMDMHPWDYWKKNGDPQAWTPQILEVFEKVMDLDPTHPGANHLYIHAIEASPTPEMGLVSAHRLNGLVPGAGHLIHMPSHIYIRTGDYHRGTLANERAVQADNAYVTQCHQQGIYPLAYVPHNFHFLWATATLEGRKERALEAAKMTSKLADTSMMRIPGMGTLQHYWIIPLYSYVRFGQWGQILNHPQPADDLLYPLGIWHYARGMAYTAQHNLDAAKSELEKVHQIAQSQKLEEVTIWDINTTQQLVRIADLVLEGEIAATNGNMTKAIESLEKAVKIEDQLNYNEPPDWFFPIRQNLGAVLIQAGQLKRAEKVFEEDLQKFPENGWSLYGLYQSLEMQNRHDEATLVKDRFQLAWRYSDIVLKSSRIK